MSQSISLDEPLDLLPALFDASYSNSFLLSLNSELIIQYASDNVLPLLGLNSRDIVGKPLTQYLSSSEINSLVRNIRWHSILETSVLNYQCELLDSSQQVIPAVLWCSGVYEHNRVIGMISIFEIHQSRLSFCSDERTQLEHAKVEGLVERLSENEREVVELVVAGQMNKAIAKMLGVAVRTVEARRSRAMTKLQVRSLSGLVKVWLVYNNHG